MRPRDLLDDLGYEYGSSLRCPESVGVMRGQVRVSTGNREDRPDRTGPGQSRDLPDLAAKGSLGLVQDKGTNLKKEVSFIYEGACWLIGSGLVCMLDPAGLGRCIILIQ